MKKFTSLFLVLLICYFTAFAEKQKIINLNSSDTDELTVLQNNLTSLKLKSSVSQILVTEIRKDELIFNNLFVKSYEKNLDAIGKPQLPINNRFIEIPHGATIQINILSYDEEIIYLNNEGITDKLFPVQSSYSKSTDPSQIVFEYDQATYQIDDFNQDEMVEVNVSGIMRGLRFGTVSISPFRYNPVQNILKVYNNIEFEIVFVNADIPLTNQLKKKYYSPYFESSFRLMLNYVPDATKDAITTYPITYIIVADPAFETTLQPFIEWKTKTGFKVIEGYTDVIGTTTTDIHNYLENLYLTEVPTPTFVLFVGDYAEVPAYSGTTGSHVSDLYYCTYDGASDYIPDMYYGRFSAGNTTELQSIIEKTLMHEQYTWPSDLFLDECLLVAGCDAGFAPSHGNGQICYGINEYFNAGAGYTDIYAYYYGNTSWQYSVMDSDAPGASADIISKISSGLGFANYTAHCDQNGWADPSFTIPNIPGLANTDEYPLMIGNCCLSNKFEVNDCFGEEILYAPKKGAIGYIGGSNSTYWDEDFWWGVGLSSLSITAANAQNHNYSNTDRGTYDGMWHTHGEPEAYWYITAAEMIHCGNLSVESSSSSLKKYYWEIYHLMGDPSLMAYITKPDPLTVSYVDPIVVGTSSLLVNTEQYAYVAISQAGVLLDAQYTGTNTSVTLTFPAFASPGQADVVVTKQDRQPYIGTVDIINVASDNDASVFSIDVPVDLYDCVQDIQPQVTIRNMGNINLTSVDVNYQIDGGAVTTFNWSGNLVQYASDVVTFPSMTLTIGNHTFTAFTENPNGTTDDYTANDTLSKNYDVNSLTITASFTADETIFCSVPATVTFTNTSTNALTYLWDFGDGNTSTDENPVNVYTVLGDYTVTLTATNGVCGSDVDIQIDYISIDPSNPCEYIMPTTGTVTETACDGTLFDSGGSTANYGDNEDGIFIISPSGASSVTVEFISLDIELETNCGYDYVEVHDGVGTGTPSLGKFCNGSLP